MMMPINDIKPENNVAKALWLEHDASWTTVFYGLLHDGHEYIFGDIISPMKSLISQLEFFR